MSDQKKKDNSTFLKKAQLRSHTLMMIDKPIVLEAYGGAGRLFARCYSHLLDGVVFESDPGKVAQLGLQRPSWAVYQCDSVQAIQDGVAAHLPVNFLDIDPYGDPWPAIEAFFSSSRPRPDRLAIVVNDGLRQKLRMNGGWTCKSLQTVVDRMGNACLHDQYLEVCRDLIQEKAAKAAYRLDRWVSYYCGHQGMMTHYAAIFVR
jgi:hypothetical protein